MPEPAPEKEQASVAPRPAWYSARRGPGRDWISVLHVPYTAWHLGYVLIGAGLAAHVSIERLGATLVAFFLAVGVAAHGLDEVAGRPLGTTIPAPALVGVSVASLAGAVAIGIVGIGRVGWGLAWFIGVGVVLVVGYNLELAGGRMHNDTVFALSWGSFPLLTAYYAQTGTVRLSAVVGAGFAFALSRAQRVLSTEARDIRRRVIDLSGERVYRDGTRRAISPASVLQPIEAGLLALSWSTAALGTALILARTGH